MKHLPPHHRPEGDPPKPVSARLKAFIKAVTPPKPGPAQELTERFRENSRRDNLKGLIVTHMPRDPADYFVELRIREWMLRKEREEAAQRKANEQKNKNPPPPHR